MADFEREIELVDYIEVVLKRKWLILAATLACMAGAALQSKRVPIVYQASTLVYVAPGKQAQAGNIKATEMELPALSATFYGAVALADEIRLIMNRVRDDLASEMGVPPAGFSLDAEMVADSGMLLKVSSSEARLPVPLVNAWADTFMVRIDGLSATAIGRVWRSMAAQYETAQQKLDQAEDDLAAYNQNGRIPFLEGQRDTYGEKLSFLEQDVMSKRLQVRSQEDELRRAQSATSEMELNGTPIHLLPRADLATIETDLLPPLGRQMAETVLELQQLRAHRQELWLAGELELARFDAQTGFPALGRRVEGLEQAVDSLGTRVRQAEAVRLEARLRLAAVEGEMANHEPTLRVGKTLGDDALWRAVGTAPMSPRKAASLDQVKLISEEPNPAYLRLDSVRAAEGLRYQTALLRLGRGREQLAAIRDTLLGLRGPYGDLSLRRERMVERRDAEDAALESQIKVVDRLYQTRVGVYEGYLTTAANLQAKLPERRQELQDLEAQLKALRTSSAAVLKELRRLTAQRQRLLRVQTTYEATFQKFAKLAEEARIARQLAATNIRVITRAVTANAVDGHGHKKVWVSGAVGLMVSVFLAFLLEYVARARALREEATGTGASAS